MKKLNQSTSFGHMAKMYQKYRRSYDVQLYDLLFSLLPQNKLSVLDIGCGTGKSTEPLVEVSSGKEVTAIGIDPDSAMLREACLSAKKKKLKVGYVQMSAENLAFDQETFDAVISGAAFHWYGNKRTLSKIQKTLKLGGLIFIFWVQYKDTDKETIGLEVYKRYDWQGIPQKFRGQEYVCKLLVDSGFERVTSSTLDFTEEKTIPEVIGNLKTNYSFALFSDADKKSFVKEMTCAYKKALGKNGVDRNDLELRICYGHRSS